MWISMRGGPARLFILYFMGFWDAKTDLRTLSAPLESTLSVELGNWPGVIGLIQDVENFQNMFQQHFGRVPFGLAGFKHHQLRHTSLINDANLLASRRIRDHALDLLGVIWVTPL